MTSPNLPLDAATLTPDQALGPRARVLASLLYRLDVHRRGVEQRSPLNVAEGRLLWLLSDRRPRTLREIAEALELEQSTVNRQVNGAIAAGLVRRIAEPGRAARLVEPTDAGVAAFETATSNALQSYDAGLDALGSGEAEELLELLGRFVDAYAPSSGS